MNGQTLKKSLQLSGNLRDFRYIVRLKEKNRLYLGGYNLNARAYSRLFEDFRLFVKNTENLYEGQWDFDFDVVFHNGKVQVRIKSIILRFEEFDIKNRYKRTHTIKDLLVKIDLGRNSNRLVINTIYGNRLVITKAEYDSNYWHSHLSGDLTRNMRTSVNSSWQSFCTGSGEINAYRMELNEDGMQEQGIIAFLLQLTTLVTYESLEGGPYREIKYITSKSVNNTIRPGQATLSINSHREYYNRWISRFRTLNSEKSETQKIVPGVKFEWTENGYSLINTDELDKVFKVYAYEAGESFMRRYYCIKDEQGNVFKVPGGDNNRGAAPNVSNRTYLFRGEVLQSRILNGDGEQMEGARPSDYVIKPEIRNYIINRINNEINKKAVRQSTINRYQS